MNNPDLNKLAREAAERLLGIAAYSHLRSSPKELAYVTDAFLSVLTKATEADKAMLRKAHDNCIDYKSAKVMNEISEYLSGESRARAAPASAEQQDTWLNEFHRVNVMRQHEAFAPAHSLLGLIACVAEEVGELSGAALGVTGEKKRKLGLTNDDMLDAVADAMTYLSLVADRCGCSDLQSLLGETFNMVSDRVGSKCKIAAQPQKERTGGK